MYWALENGISYDTSNYNGTNLAMYVMTNAINTGNYNKFELFLERYKSEIYKRDYNGNDLEFYAKKRKSSKAIELIKSEYLITKSKSKVMKTLEKEGYDVDAALEGMSE